MVLNGEGKKGAFVSIESSSLAHLINHLTAIIFPGSFESSFIYTRDRFLPHAGAYKGLNWSCRILLWCQ